MFSFPRERMFHFPSSSGTSVPNCSLISHQVHLTYKTPPWEINYQGRVYKEYGRGLVVHVFQSSKKSFTKAEALRKMRGSKWDLQNQTSIKVPKGMGTRVSLTLRKGGCMKKRLYVPSLMLEDWSQWSKLADLKKKQRQKVKVLQLNDVFP